MVSESGPSRGCVVTSAATAHRDCHMSLFAGEGEHVVLRGEESTVYQETWGRVESGRQYYVQLYRGSTTGGGRRPRATAALGSLALSELRHTP